MSTSEEQRSHRLTRRHLLCRSGLAVASLAMLQACGNGSAREAADESPVVDMNDRMQFVPASLTIRVGQSVTWKNGGAMVHTSTCDPAIAQRAEHAVRPDGAEPWDSGLIRAGESWSRRFDVPGEYAYFCTPHEAAGMIGSLIVEG